MHLLHILGGLFLLGHLQAQHCAYDFASLIVVRPHAEEDTTLIEGLRITLLDSNNLPVVLNNRTMRPFRANSKVRLEGLLRTNFAVSDHFPFARDNYVLVVPNGFRVQKMKVLVQDERDTSPLNKRRDRWPVRYRQQVVPLSVHDSYRLCGTHDNASYPELHDRPAYHPIEIILQPL